MRLLGKIDAVFVRTLGIFAFLMGVLLILMMLGISVDIYMRYFHNRAIYWMEEICRYGLLYITFLSAAWVLKQDRHVRMDIVLIKLSERQRTVVNIGTSALGALICLFVTWYSGLTVLESFQEGYRVNTLLKPLEAPILVVIPLGSFLLSIEFLKMMYRHLRSRGAT